MKRVVQCPKCDAKLSVFDSGKPINQKCPKCRESFVVESEEAKSAGEDKPAAAAADSASEKKTDQPADAKADTKTDAKTPEKGDVKADAKPGTPADAKAETKAEDKTSGKPEEKAESKTDAKTEAKTDAKAEAVAGKDVAKKSIVKTAVSSQPKSTPSPEAAAPLPSHVDSSISYMDVMMILGLLVLSLIIQVVGIRKNAVRFNALDDQIQSLQAQLNTLKK